MRITRSMTLAFRMIQPSRPATRANVPIIAVKMLQRDSQSVAVLSTPIRSTGLSRKKNGMMKPMSPRRTAHSPVFV